MVLIAATQSSAMVAISRMRCGCQQFIRAASLSIAADFEARAWEQPSLVVAVWACTGHIAGRLDLRAPALRHQGRLKNPAVWLRRAWPSEYG